MHGQEGMDGKEWKFKETTSDEKIYTGRSYPAREYLHTITLHDGRTITGPLAAIVYVQPQQYDSSQPSEHAEPKAERFLLNKRNKGELGQELKSLVYVKRIKLGKEALEEGEEEDEADRTIRSDAECEAASDRMRSEPISSPIPNPQSLIPLLHVNSPSPKVTASRRCWRSPPWRSC